MVLINCKECGKEVSKSAKTCPHCGVNKPYKREPTKQQNIAFGLILILIFLMLYESPSKKAEKLKNEMEHLSISIKKIPFEKIEKNLNGYKKLSEYYPNNKHYKEKYNFYQSRYDFMANCRYLALQINKRSLKNPSTYNDIVDRYLYENWNTVNKYEYQSSFSGKNAFGIEQKFVAKYICNYNNGKTKIRRVFIKKH